MLDHALEQRVLGADYKDSSRNCISWHRYYIVAHKITGAALENASLSVMTGDAKTLSSLAIFTCEVIFLSGSKTVELRYLGTFVFLSGVGANTTYLLGVLQL